MGSPRDEVIEGIERLLDVKFQDRSLVETALGIGPAGDGETADASYSREHLAVLGSAVMDVVVAAELCRLHPEWPAGQLAVTAARTLSHGSLVRVAVQHGIAEALRMGRGEGKATRGSPGSLDTAVQALAGALFLDYRQRTPPHHPDDEAYQFFWQLAGHALQTLGRRRGPSPAPNESSGASASLGADTKARAPSSGDLLETLQLRFGLHFRNRALWEHALLHAHAGRKECCPGMPSREHIRFIGTAAFRAHVTVLAMLEHQIRRPDRLEKLRAKLAMAHTRSVIAEQLGLGQPTPKSRRKAGAGGHETGVEAAEMLERVVGALFLDVSDSDRAHLVTSRAILKLLAPVLHAGEEQPRADSKTPLGVLCQKQLNTAPVYKVVEESGPAHERAFVVSVSVAGVALGLGRGRTKKEAEQNAAKEALQKAQQGKARQDSGGRFDEARNALRG
jgi:ribonuclease-3